MNELDIEEIVHQHNEVSAYAEDWWDSPYDIIEDGEHWEQIDGDTFQSKMIVYHRELGFHAQILRKKRKHAFSEEVILPIKEEDVSEVIPMETLKVIYVPKQSLFI